MNARFAILLFAVPGMLAAQAMVENAMGVGRAATSTAPAQNAGKAIGEAFGSLSRTLDPAEAKAGGATPAAARPAARSAKSTPARPQKAAVEPEPEVTFEDPSGIQEGMEYAEIVRRFGPPSLKLTSGPGEETLSYARNNRNVGVTMHDGKVSSVQKAGA